MDSFPDSKLSAPGAAMNQVDNMTRLLLGAGCDSETYTLIKMVLGFIRESDMSSEDASQFTAWYLDFILTAGLEGYFDDVMRYVNDYEDDDNFDMLDDAVKFHVDDLMPAFFRERAARDAELIPKPKSADRPKVFFGPPLPPAMQRARDIASGKEVENGGISERSSDRVIVAEKGDEPIFRSVGSNAEVLNGILSEVKGSDVDNPDMVESIKEVFRSADEQGVEIAEGPVSVALASSAISALHDKKTRVRSDIDVMPGASVEDNYDDLNSPSLGEKHKYYRLELYKIVAKVCDGYQDIIAVSAMKGRGIRGLGVVARVAIARRERRFQYVNLGSTDEPTGIKALFREGAWNRVRDRFRGSTTLSDMIRFGIENPNLVYNGKFVMNIEFGGDTLQMKPISVSFVRRKDGINFMQLLLYDGDWQIPVNGTFESW